jgi:predicted transcriptional regulator
VDALVVRLFAGQSLPLVRHLVEDRRFSAEEIEQLRQLIDRMEDDQHES